MNLLRLIRALQMIRRLCNYHRVGGLQGVHWVPVRVPLIWYTNGGKDRRLNAQNRSIFELDLSPTLSRFHDGHLEAIRHFTVRRHWHFNLAFQNVTSLQYSVGEYKIISPFDSSVSGAVFFSSLPSLLDGFTSAFAAFLVQRIDRTHSPALPAEL